MTKSVSVIAVRGNTAFIRLGVGLDAMIDAQDLPIVSGKRWRCMRVRSGKIMVYYQENGANITLHRLIAAPDASWNVYHKNGDGLDNRRKNLIVPAVMPGALRKKKALKK